MARNSSAAAGEGRSGRRGASQRFNGGEGRQRQRACGHHHGQLGAGRHRGLGQALLQHRRRPSRWRPAAPQIALAEGQSRHIGVAARQHRQHAAQRQQQAGHARGRQGLAPDQRFQQRYQDGAARRSARYSWRCVLRADDCGATATPMPSTARGSSEAAAQRLAMPVQRGRGDRQQDQQRDQPAAEGQENGEGRRRGPIGPPPCWRRKRGALKSMAVPARPRPGRAAGAAV